MREFVKFFLLMCFAVIATGMLSCNEEKIDSIQREKVITEAEETDTPRFEVTDDNQMTAHFSMIRDHYFSDKILMLAISTKLNDWKKENPQKRIVSASFFFNGNADAWGYLQGLYLIYEIVPPLKTEPKEQPSTNTGDSLARPSLTDL